MTKTVLSIDVDWVYNWQQYRELTRIVCPMIVGKQFNSIEFGSSHNEIDRLINTYSEPVKIVNIDHHHDFEYTHSGCGIDVGYKYCNWLGWYYTNGKIIDPVWIANPNSDMYTGAPVNQLEGYFKIEFDLDNLSSYSFDSLFVCQSPAHITNNGPAYATYETFRLITEIMEDNNG